MPQSLIFLIRHIRCTSMVLYIFVRQTALFQLTEVLSPHLVSWFKHIFISQSENSLTAISTPLASCGDCRIGCEKYFWSNWMALNTSLIRAETLHGINYSSDTSSIKERCISTMACDYWGQVWLTSTQVDKELLLSYAANFVAPVVTRIMKYSWWEIL